jgi:flagellar hook-length control protein FliK
MPASVVNILPVKPAAAVAAKGSKSEKREIKGEDFDAHLDGAKKAAGKEGGEGKLAEAKAEPLKVETPKDGAAKKGGAQGAKKTKAESEADKAEVATSGDTGKDPTADLAKLPEGQGSLEPEVVVPVVGDRKGKKAGEPKSVATEAPVAVVAGTVNAAVPVKEGVSAGSAKKVDEASLGSVAKDLTPVSSSSAAAPVVDAASDDAASDHARSGKAAETVKAFDAHVAAKGKLQEDLTAPLSDVSVKGPQGKSVVQPAVPSQSNSTADALPPAPNVAVAIDAAAAKHVGVKDDDGAVVKAGVTNIGTAQPAGGLASHVKNVAEPIPLPPEQRFSEANHASIISSVKTNLLPHGGSMQIRLDPPELGALQVSVEMRDGAMTATFQTSNEDATRLLSHSLGQLKTALESQGVTVEKIQVQQSPKDSHAKNGEDSSAQQQRDEANARQENDRREMLRKMWRRVSGTAEPVDLVA